MASKYAHPPDLLRKNQTGSKQIGHRAFGSSGGGFHDVLAVGTDAARAGDGSSSQRVRPNVPNRGYDSKLSRPSRLTV